MKILVTGAAGYIGSHFSQVAATEGHSLVVVDDLSTGHREFARYGQFYLCDVKDREEIRRLVQKHQIEAVIHFAAKALVEESLRFPDVYELANVVTTRQLAQAIENTSVKYFVFSSSGAVYGSHDQPVQESDEKKPVNPYGKTKLEGENFLLEWSRQNGISLAILRYFNVIGQDPKNELYEWHEPETHILPNLMRAEIENRKLTLFGSQHPTPDGTCVRDFVDVNDLARVHLAALKRLETEGGSFTSNIGTGESTSLLQLVLTYEKVFSTKVHYEFAAQRPGDPHFLVACAKRFQSWYPQKTKSLEESIRTLEKRREVLLAKLRES